MLLQEILQPLKSGKKVSRKAFEEFGEIYLYFVNNIKFDHYHNHEYQAYYTGLIAYKDGSEYLTNIDGESLFADDWYILDNEK